MILINEFGEKYIDGKTVTFYKIEIYDNYSKNWFLEKRYSEIDLLHKTLAKLYPNIPPMPGKTLFKIKDRDQLEKRKKQLETFLKECAKRKDIESNDSFKAFLELDLGLPGKEKLIKEISYFGGNLEIRIVRFNAIDREIYTGDQKGKITVWSLKSGQSIYAWQAHSDAITQMKYFQKKKDNYYQWQKIKK